MIMTETQGQLSTATEAIEAAYHSLESIKTNSDLESTVKGKILLRIKSLLIEAVILMDLVDEINSNPDDELTLSSTLDLIADSEEMLS